MGKNKDNLIEELKATAITPKPINVRNNKNSFIQKLKCPNCDEEVLVYKNKTTNCPYCGTNVK